AMSPSDVLNRSFALYQGHWQHLIGIGLTIWVGVAIVAAVLSLLGIVGGLLGAIALIIGAYLLQGAIVSAVDDLQDGRIDMSIGETVRAAQPHLLALIVAGIIVGVLVTIGLFLFLIPGLILMTLWFVTAPSIVIEKLGAIDGMQRSWNLVKGQFWQTLLLALLTFFLVIVAVVLASIILSFLPNFLASLIANIVVNSVVGPFWAVVSALAFFTLRDRRSTPQAPAPESNF
ncbi:MAG: hypothetical protein ACR2N6_09025, partial [Miltoncostaeaceae bacterium]